MQTYIHARLNPYDLSPELQTDAQARSRVLCEEVQRRGLDDLRSLAIRRATREKPVPPYIPFAIAVDPETASKLRQLPKNASISALVQNLLRR